MNQARVAEQAPAARPKRETLKLGSKPVARSAPVAPHATLIVPSAPRLFALGRLMRAAENVRHTRIDEPRYAFVPLGQKGAVDKPALVDVAADRERDAVADRERQILRWSRRLAVPPFAGTPLEGRAFWPEPHLDRQTPETLGGVPGFMVSVLAFVTNDEIAAQRKAATKHVDQLIAARDRQQGSGL